MKNFWGYVSNGEYSVGCTGQTVYLYDKDNNEIKKYKDIICAYTPMISPDGKIFVVKSADGRIAVYSLESFALIKKIRYTKFGDDGGFCFSPDGQFFINIGCGKDSLHSAIYVYNTSDFSLTNRIDIDNKMMVRHIEFDENTNSYYVLGFVRGDDGVLQNGFVAKFENQQIGTHLAITGAIKDDILPIDDIGLYLVDFLKEYYPNSLIDRYQLDINRTNIEIIESLGKKQNYYLYNSKDVDSEKTIKFLLQEFRNNDLGKITLDQYEELPSEE